MGQASELEISVVLPACDEVESLEPLIDEIREALASRSGWEIVAVDDGSTDGTDACLSKLSGEWSWLRQVRHASNRGQSTALYTGILAARGEWIVTLDADGQNDPADIPLLLRARERHGAGALLVAGIRERRRDTAWRRFQTRVANGVRSRLLRDGCPDSGCGLKLFRRRDFLRLPAFEHMHRFLPALFLRLGAATLYVPVGHRPRLRGRSKYGMMNRLWTGIVDLLGVAWLIHRPLHLETDVRIDDFRGEDLAGDRVRGPGAVRDALPGPVDRE